MNKIHLLETLKELLNKCTRHQLEKDHMWEGRKVEVVDFYDLLYQIDRDIDVFCS